MMEENFQALTLIQILFHNIMKRILQMKTKKEIVDNWLPRYTGVPLNEFGHYIILTNFGNYVEMFAKQFGVVV